MAIIIIIVQVDFFFHIMAFQGQAIFSLNKKSKREIAPRDKWLLAILNSSQGFMSR